MIMVARARSSSVSIQFSTFNFKVFWPGCHSILGEFPDIPILRDSAKARGTVRGVRRYPQGAFWLLISMNATVTLNSYYKIL